MSKISNAFSTTRRRVSDSMRRAKLALSRSVTVLLEPIGFREVLLICGSGLVGFGAHYVYPPAAYIAPGLVFVGVAIFGVRG